MSYKLKEIGQGVMLGPGGGPSAKGVCYYMCNFVETHLWSGLKSFDEGMQRAADFAQGTAMTNYAKAQNLKEGQWANYQDNGNPLPAERLIRAGLKVGNAPCPDNLNPCPNHEILLLTGKNQDCVLYEPNFGFYYIQEAGLSNREALEDFVQELYRNVPVSQFEYKNVRALNAAQPLGFPTQATK